MTPDEATAVFIERLERVMHKPPPRRRNSFRLWEPSDGAADRDAERYLDQLLEAGDIAAETRKARCYEDEETFDEAAPG